MPRPLNIIAAEILTAFRSHPNFAPQKRPSYMTFSMPYVEAMLELKDASGFYGVDPADDIILRFLTNSTPWRHPRAAFIRAELREHLGEFNASH